MGNAQHQRPLFFGVIGGTVLPTVLLTLTQFFSSDRTMVHPFLFVLIGGPTLLAVSTIGAWPIALALRRANALTTLSLCVIGAVVGALFLAAFNYHGNYWPEMNDQTLARWVALNSAKKALFPGALVGIVSGLGFAVGAGVPAWRKRAQA